MRRRARFLILVVVAGSLAACKSNPPVQPPKVVQTVVIRTVPVPKELTAPCAIAKPMAKTVGEAVRVARERLAALQKCNAQLEEIRNLAQ